MTYNSGKGVPSHYLAYDTSLEYVTVKNTYSFDRTQRYPVSVEVRDFNLINEVYNQKPNYFKYHALDYNILNIWKKIQV